MNKAQSIVDKKNYNSQQLQYKDTFVSIIARFYCSVLNLDKLLQKNGNIEETKKAFRLVKNYASEIRDAIRNVNINEKIDETFLINTSKNTITDEKLILIWECAKAIYMATIMQNKQNNTNTSLIVASKRINEILKKRLQEYNDQYNISYPFM